jgi:hypothetical protein
MQMEKHFGRPSTARAKALWSSKQRDRGDNVLRKAVILDTVNSVVYLGNVSKDGDAEELIGEWCDELGISLSNCQWMVGDNIRIEF